MVVIYNALIKYFTLWYLVMRGMLFSAVTVAVVVIGVDDDIVNVPSVVTIPACAAVTSLLTWSIPVSALIGRSL